MYTYSHALMQERFVGQITVMGANTNSNSSSNNDNDNT